MMNRTEYNSVIDVALEEVLPLMKNYPAALTHHHKWKGGLLQHTREVVDYADRLYHVMDALMNFTNYELAIAAYLHDVGKMLDYKEENKGRFIWRINCPSSIESKLLQDVWIHMYKKPTQRIPHEIVSLEIAKRIFRKAKVKMTPNIRNAIICHMGGWSKSGVKPKPIAYMLHCADLLGSQFEEEK